MTDGKVNKEEVEELVSSYEAASDLERIKHETNERKIKLEARKTTIELERLEREQHELNIIKNTDFSKLSPKEIKDLQNEQKDYIAAAQDIMQFINQGFGTIVPFFRNNLILIGAKTGDGKSTAVANIVFSVLRQKSKRTGKYGRALVLSNEENVGDVYSRIIAMGKGWPYSSHDKFTTEQAEAFAEGIEILGKNGKLMVVKDNHNGAKGVTTTPEGIRDMFDNLIANKVWYDVVIIDYYQNVKESKDDPKLDIYSCQAKFCEVLDHYKNIYPAPIVLLAQMEPTVESNKKPYDLRIQGRKLIVNKATCILEMVKNKETYTTDFIVQKNRFNGDSVNEIIKAGFDKGRYVENSDEFKAKVQVWKDRKAEAELNKELGADLKQRMEQEREEEENNVPE